MYGTAGQRVDGFETSPPQAGIALAGRPRYGTAGQRVDGFETSPPQAGTADGCWHRDQTVMMSIDW